MNDTLILCYHGVSEGWPADISISPGRLADQVRWFLDRGFRPATFTQAVTGEVGGRVIAVTFDDAYRSVARLGLPLLETLGVRATVFAPTAFVGDPSPRGWEGTDFWAHGDWADEIAVMDWPELRGLADAGWEVGSHTRTLIQGCRRWTTRSSWSSWPVHARRSRARWAHPAGRSRIPTAHSIAAWHAPRAWRDTRPPAGCCQDP